MRKYKIVAFWFSLRAMFEQNLGDKVKYNGKVYTLEQGTRPNQCRIETYKDGSELWVDRDELKKVMTLSGMRRSFFLKWNFYKGYWFDIWEYKGGIGNLAKSCNIWGNYKWSRKNA